ncbi:MAG TPA: hypothetical protein VKI43_07265 [Vicinamibacterales bacterium]|nr:hypothetical protein [Vicinamibacterales bacterium]
MRPAMGMPWKAFGTAKISAKASVIALPPAPPVSTRVPSMSKRISVEALVAPVAPVLVFAANVAGARPFGRRFFVEGDALAFIQ